MRPTLYADDVVQAWGDHAGPVVHYKPLMAVARILPRRCESCWGAGELDVDECEARGWLYPPMPDWWPSVTGWPDDHDIHWQHTCGRMWRAMGITE